MMDVPSTVFTSDVSLASGRVEQIVHF
jgi:hypothetical protein